MNHATNSAFPHEHPHRAALTNEVHARQPPALTGNMRASHLAILCDGTERDLQYAHLAQLCANFGIAPPAPGSSWFRADLGPLELLWETHGEFVAITLLAPAVPGPPFEHPATSLLPAPWLAQFPGRTLVAAHAEFLIDDPAAPIDHQHLDRWFGANLVLGSEIGDGAGMAFTDFRLHGDGFSRFLLVSRSLTERQSGRMLKRLFEIESYRMLALLALPLARRKAPELDGIGTDLGRVIEAIAAGERQDEVLLPELTDLSARIEREIAEVQFRFECCRGYHGIVRRRIDELRERRIPGMQPIEEFMARRLWPAVSRVDSVQQRLSGLSQRVARASSLLSTRVEIAHSRQNQSLLASMDRRASLQLRLQQTVEGLSVAAITYYTLGLVSYAAKGLHGMGLPIAPDVLVACALPLVLVGVLLGLRRVHRSLHAGGH